MTYEAWRISYQSSEQAARAAYAECERLQAKITEMEQQEPVASIYIDGKGDREFDDWKCDLPAGSNLLYALPGAQPAPSVSDDVVEQAVNRFLSWKLPKDFQPDGGMVFIPTKGRGYDSPHWPIGTNLFNAEQAREMLRYVLAAAPEAK